MASVGLQEIPEMVSSIGHKGRRPTESTVDYKGNSSNTQEAMV